ncbi:sulfatase [bacterium]|nr:sulfatase [candidate division CSSED10-310 bacterium]
MKPAGGTRRRPLLSAAAAALVCGILLSAWEWLMLVTRSMYAPTGLIRHLEVILLATAIYGLFAFLFILPFHLPYWLKQRPFFFAKLLILPVLISSCGIVNRYTEQMSRKLPVTGAGRNLILVTLDTVRDDFLGCYGHPTIKTPFLDRFSRQGALFADVVCPAPMTTPSHASLLTATIPRRHGAADNRYRLGADNVSLAELLVQAGYTTAAFVSCYPLNHMFGLNQGFMIYDDIFIERGGWRELVPVSMVNRWRRRGLLERDAGMVNRAILPWLETHRDHTFFLWIHYFDAHAPYTPPPPYRGMYRDAMPPAAGRLTPPAAVEIDKACRMAPGEEAYPLLPIERYAGEISRVDRALEDVFMRLEQLDMLRDSVVVVTADHGESLGEHEYFFSHGALLFDPSITVPLLASLPDDRASRLLAAQVRLIDLAPTILDYLGLPIHERMEGTSLLPRMKGGREQVLPALIENIGIILAPGAVKMRGLRAYDWKRLEGADECAGLYDLRADPNEMHNLCGTESELSATMRDMTKDGFARASGERIDSPVLLDEEVRDKLQQLGYIR